MKLRVTLVIIRETRSIQLTNLMIGNMNKYAINLTKRATHSIRTLKASEVP